MQTLGFEFPRLIWYSNGQNIVGEVQHRRSAIAHSLSWPSVTDRLRNHPALLINI